MASHASRWAAVLVYMAVIFWFSSKSTVPPIPESVSYYEVHLVVYAGLGALMARAIAGPAKRVSFLAVGLAAVLSTAYGVSDEAHQRFVPGRQFDYLDIAADAAGSLLGAMTIGAWSIISASLRRDVL